MIVGFDKKKKWIANRSSSIILRHRLATKVSLLDNHVHIKFFRKLQLFNLFNETKDYCVFFSFLGNDFSGVRAKIALTVDSREFLLFDIKDFIGAFNGRELFKCRGLLKFFNGSGIACLVFNSFDSYLIALTKLFVVERESTEGLEVLLTRELDRFISFNSGDYSESIRGFYCAATLSRQRILVEFCSLLATPIFFLTSAVFKSYEINASVLAVGLGRVIFFK